MQVPCYTIPSEFLRITLLILLVSFATGSFLWSGSKFQDGRAVYETSYFRRNRQNKVTEGTISLILILTMD